VVCRHVSLTNHGKKNTAQYRPRGRFETLPSAEFYKLGVFKQTKKFYLAEIINNRTFLKSYYVKITCPKQPS
jgi:hypothetical protein